jgi:hypothetical protein
VITAAGFLAGLTGSPDDLALAVGALRECGQPFCLIGGLAVNHDAEPVVTLDADSAIASSEGVAEALRPAGFVVDEFPLLAQRHLSGQQVAHPDHGQFALCGLPGSRNASGPGSGTR